MTFIHPCMFHLSSGAPVMHANHAAQATHSEPCHEIYGLDNLGVWLQTVNSKSRNPLHRGVVGRWWVGGCTVSGGW